VDEPLGLLALDELAELSELLDEALLPETPSAESVFESSVPLAWMPCCCWNCFTAARVFGPILPSAVTLMPFSLKACCASRMVEESELLDEALPLLSIEEPVLLLPIEEPLVALFLIDEPLLLLPIDDVSLPEAAPFDEWLEPDCDVPCARTAVLEKMSAARVSLRMSM